MMTEQKTLAALGLCFAQPFFGPFSLPVGQRMVLVRRIKSQDLPMRMHQGKSAQPALLLESRIRQDNIEIAPPSAEHVMIAVQAPRINIGGPLCRPELEKVGFCLARKTGIVHIPEVNDMNLAVLHQRLGEA